MLLLLGKPQGHLPSEMISFGFDTRIDAGYTITTHHIVAVMLKDDALILSKSTAMERLACEGDLADAKGNPNTAGILKTLEALRDRLDGTAERPQVAYLVHHVKYIFDAL